MEDAVFFTEQKVLHIAKTNEIFKVSVSHKYYKEIATIVENLLKLAYLKPIGEIGSVSAYKITSEGKKHLHRLENLPKHNCDGAVVAKGLLLEQVITKRLNILKNANRRGLEFNLTDANVRALLNKKHCYYTGVEFDDENPLNARTFERVDDSKGYIQGNVVVVTDRANKIKNMLMEGDHAWNIGVDGFIMMAEQIKKHLGK